MKNHDEILGMADALTAAIAEAAPCECDARSGYVHALTQVVKLLDTAPIAQAGLDAVIDDRAALIELVEQRIADTLGEDVAQAEAPAEPELPEPLAELKALLEAQGLSVMAVRLP